MSNFTDLQIIEGVVCSGASLCSGKKLCGRNTPTLRTFIDLTE